MTVFSLRHENLSQRPYFCRTFFACGGLINLRVTFGNSFFTQKAVWKTLLSSVFETVFLVKKEFPNVTRKLISPPQAKKNSGENTVAETSFRDEERKRSLRQKNLKFNFFLKNEKKKTIVPPNPYGNFRKKKNRAAPPPPPPPRTCVFSLALDNNAYFKSSRKSNHYQDNFSALPAETPFLLNFPCMGSNRQWCMSFGDWV